ncbi:hypothetical protein D3C78_1193550 [compost metagenome]
MIAAIPTAAPDRAIVFPSPLSLAAYLDTNVNALGTNNPPANPCTKRTIKRYIGSFTSIYMSNTLAVATKPVISTIFPPTRSIHKPAARFPNIFVKEYSPTASPVTIAPAPRLFANGPMTGSCTNKSIKHIKTRLYSINFILVTIYPPFKKNRSQKYIRLP